MTFPTAKFPHCDERVLHAPSKCVYCDHFPQLQDARIHENINFTGELYSYKMPDPATQIRPLLDIYRWSGNVAAKPFDTKPTVKPDRPSWDEYFTNIAAEVAQRATCQRAKVGVVVVDMNNRIVVTAYNGAPAGQPHCPDDESLKPEDRCPRSIHAEMNAVIEAATSGKSIVGCTWYLWSESAVDNWVWQGKGPCDKCYPLVMATDPLRMVEMGQDITDLVIGLQ